jgi:transmembrane sensor
MTEAREPLGRHITPKYDEARLARQREVIATRLRTRRPRWVLLLGPAVCVVAVVVLLLIRSRANTGNEAVAGTVVEAPAGEPLRMTLLDGSHVVLDPSTRLSLMTLLPKDVRLELKSGAIDLDVPHLEGREFVVTAAGYEVRVLGTHFAVRLRPAEERPALEVEVFRGRVRVTRTGEPADLRVLGAGERWSTTLGTGTNVPPPRAQAPDPTPAPPMTSVTTDAHAPIVLPSAPVPVPTAARVGAKELWSQAEAARASKRFQDEALALDTLRLKHRSDPRAGLAAFELGRLRQDTLHDAAGAADAFADAIVLAPNGPFREDAEARRVEALDAAGRRERCIEARTAFLARYAGGIHRQRVATMCESR